MPTGTRRRALLAAGAAGMAGLAGCLGGSSSPPPAGDLPPDEDPDDGYPPRFGETPTARPVDTDAFGTVEVEGVAVPLAPIEVARYWYRRREARFADARGREQYENSHVYGAVLSPAPNGRQDDPVGDWPEDDRIVAYCGCPHHLSSLRAASLIADGYGEVYVIDEGFWEWHDRGYPMAGREVGTAPPAYVVHGLAAARFAGGTAWAVHGATGQREAAPIGSDGRYRLELRFAGVTPESVIEVRTPGYAVRGPLSALRAAPVTRSMADADG